MTRPLDYILFIFTFILLTFIIDIYIIIEFTIREVRITSSSSSSSPVSSTNNRLSAVQLIKFDTLNIDDVVYSAYD